MLARRTQSLLFDLNLRPVIQLAIRNFSPKDFRPSEELTKERYDLRANEDIEKKRARLLYQSRKRGMLENGVILASFADRFLSDFNADQLDQYDRLINLPTNDWDIYYWATKTKPTPPEYETAVMQKLREHLKIQVSISSNSNNELAYCDDHKNNTTSHNIKGSKIEKKRKSFLDNMQPDDIVLPKSNYDLDVDISNTSLVDYKNELFDERKKSYGRVGSILRMTEWRKKLFERRLKRSLPSPISLRHLDDANQAPIFTQKLKDEPNKITVPRKDLIDSNYERNLKHHNFIQHLLSSEFTTSVQDYDDEAEAWAEMLWHRNYGSMDPMVPLSSKKCSSCKAAFQCRDYGLPGYIPKELFFKLEENHPASTKCQRCEFLYTYNASLSVDMSARDYEEILKKFKMTRTSIICLLVDLTDFPSGMWTGLIDLIGVQHDVIVIGNKLDLLPYDKSHMMIDRATKSLRQNLSKLRPEHSDLHIRDTMVISAKTGFGIEGLISRILKISEIPKDIYILGSSNSGKSTLFNALLQSDLSEVRKGDLIGRVSATRVPGRPERMLRFPVRLFEGWEVAVKGRRTERVERNTHTWEKGFVSTTKMRQATMPHMSMLINRTDYTPAKSEALEVYEDRPKFTEDHPLSKTENRVPLSANELEFGESAFLHNSPSAYYKDQLHELLTVEEKLQVFPNETIVPRKYSLRPLQTIFIAGLARLDLLTSNQNVIITIFASKFLPIHVTPTRKADQFYNTFIGTPYLGVPFGNVKRLSEWPGLTGSKDLHMRRLPRTDGLTDIVLSSAGWALIKLLEDHECMFRAFTPGGRGIYRRYPCLHTGIVGGKKIRDTPLFRHSEYNIKFMTC